MTSSRPELPLRDFSIKEAGGPDFCLSQKVLRCLTGFWSWEGSGGCGIRAYPLPRQRAPEVATWQETLCPPRLSNGSEWLFHGKDEVSAGPPSPDPRPQRGRWKRPKPPDLKASSEGVVLGAPRALQDLTLPPCRRRCCPGCRA